MMRGTCVSVYAEDGEMICQYCKKDVPNLRDDVNHIVIGYDSQEDHTHVHGDIDDKGHVKARLLDVASTLGIDLGVPMTQPIKVMKEIVFHNRQRIGDMLMFTTGVRDFKTAFPDTRVNVISTAMHIWDHNPHLDRTLATYLENGHTLESIKAEDYPAHTNVVKIGPGKMTNASNRIDWHFANAYRVSMEDNLGVHIPQGESRPDIWLTREEYEAPRVTPDPYWLIIGGGEKGWGCKMYPWDRWQEVINQNPDLLFYQLGSQGDGHPKLQGKNVVDYIGKTEDRNTGIRDLFKLFLNAEGSIGLVSFHMHLSGALYKPAVVVAGAREPVSFTRYQGHQYLSNEGCLPCAETTACWHCATHACTNLVNDKGEHVTLTKEDGAHARDGIMPRCVDMIEPQDITRAINEYYRGGRLIKGQVSQKPKFKNIVETPVQVAVPAPPVADHTLDTTALYGIAFGGAEITAEDWAFIQQAIIERQVKTVLEFGSGLSTRLLRSLGVEVTSFETNEEKCKKFGATPWDGKDLKLDHFYDLAFVNGPSGGANREHSTRVASEYAGLVVVHDAGRPFERQWQAKYLEGKFSGPIKGGHRCSLWIHSPTLAEVTPPPQSPTAEATRRAHPLVAGGRGAFVKIASTARGWGGAQRSVTTIMQMLLARGHKVEFIPFHGAVTSREYLDCLKNGLKDVTVSTMDKLKEPCDVLMVYADDFCWELGRNDIVEAFSGLQAKRKIMFENYRRGDIGSAAWTREWDIYGFLNSGQERELLQIMPGISTAVLPPCTDLEPFFKVQPYYRGNFDCELRIVRHSSQGDTKFSKDVASHINSVLDGRLDASISMLPGPSIALMPDRERFTRKHRTADPNAIAQFLEKGNCFWYSLPETTTKYMDQGPRVVLEAMASGLPIIADTWGGVVDRVTPETGWLCDKAEQINLLRTVTPEELEIKGRAARERAKQHFSAEMWMNFILDPVGHASKCAV